MTHDEQAIAFDDDWNAGDMGCGELIMLLGARLKKMGPWKVLRLTAEDAGAVEDIPAWCNLTGHRLLAAQHPQYLIERREKP